MLDPADPSLVVVAVAGDDAEAASAVLERAAAGSPPWSPAAPALSRHHLRIPAPAVDAVVSTAAQEGYRRGEAPDADAPGADAPGAEGPPGGEAVTLQRVEVLDPLHLAQERSRMAGLAQRAGGCAVGWDALQPGPAPGD